eukprot:2285045-Pleurochrysis_carterae.AAC.1
MSERKPSLHPAPKRFQQLEAHTRGSRNPSFSTVLLPDTAVKILPLLGLACAATRRRRRGVRSA